MNLSQLPYVVAIAEAGNLSAAARRLGVSQPALTKYLQNLERELGVEMFFRDKGRYTPTPAGRVYLQGAQRILELTNHTRTAIDAMERQESSLLRLGMSPYSAVTALVSIYPEFDQRFPDVRMEVREQLSLYLEPMLERGELDCIVCTHSGEYNPRLRYIPLESEELVLAVPVFHPMVRHDTYALEELPYADLRDFKDAAFISTSRHSSTYNDIQKRLEQDGVSDHVVASAPNPRVAEAMIRSGTKIGLLASQYIRPDSGLAYFRLQDPPRQYGHFIVRADHVMTAAEEYLLYLYYRHSMHYTNMQPIWTDLTRQLMWRYNPMEARSLGLEGADE